MFLTSASHSSATERYLSVNLNMFFCEVELVTAIEFPKSRSIFMTSSLRFLLCSSSATRTSSFCCWSSFRSRVHKTSRVAYDPLLETRKDSGCIAWGRLSITTVFSPDWRSRFVECPNDFRRGKDTHLEF